MTHDITGWNVHSTEPVSPSSSPSLSSAASSLSSTLTYSQPQPVAGTNSRLFQGLLQGFFKIVVKPKANTLNSPATGGRHAASSSSRSSSSSESLNPAGAAAAAAADDDDDDEEGAPQF